MKSNIKLFCVILLLVYSLGVNAQGNLGQVGANFLQIGVDPRGAALGGAVTATAKGAAALYWNPAGAIHTQNVDVYLANTNWFLDTHLMYGGIVKKIGNLGVVGLSATSFYMDEQEITSVYESEGTGQFYDAGDMAVGLSFARSLTDRFTFGATVKYVREYIWQESSSQVALDIGSLYRTDFFNLRLGMAVRNFSGKMQFKGENIDRRIAEELARNQEKNPRVERLAPEFRLPQIFQLGIAFDPYISESGRLTILTDVDVPADNTERVIVGAEFGFHDLAFIRSAYKFNYDASTISVGGGLNLAITGLNAMLDYAYSTHGVLGSVHQFGLGLSF